MPSFLGHMIADDAASVLERSQSPTGFISSDIPLLEFMKVIDKKGGQQQISKSLASSPQEIRDFLTWACGNKQRPLPPLARKILCLKRAIIKNSIASIGVSNQRRTGETKQLEEIDALLERDGAKDLENKELCLTEGSKFQSYAIGGVVPTPTPPSPPSGPSPMTGPGCQTHVSCDNSAMVALIGEIKTALERIESMGPVNRKTVTNAVTTVTNIPVAHPAFAEIKEQIHGLEEQIDKLSVAGSVANGMSIMKGPASVRSVVSDPGSIAKSAVEAAEKDDDEGVQTFLGQLDDNIDIMKGFTDEQVGIVKTKLAELRASKPVYGPQIDTIVARIDTLGDIPAKVDLDPVLKEVKDLVGPIPSIQTLLSDIKTRMDDPSNDSVVTDQLAIVRTAVQGLERTPEEISTILAKITTIESQLGEHRAEGTVMKDALESIKLKLEDAIAGIAGLPKNFDSIVKDVSEKVGPLITIAKDAVLEQLRLIKQDTEIIDMKVDALGRNTRNTKTGVDGLQAQLAQQSAMLSEMREEMKGMRTNITSTCAMGPIADQIAGLTANLEGLRALVEVTKVHGDSFDPIFAGIQTSLSDIAGQIAVLQAKNGDGRNNVLIAEKERYKTQVQELQRGLANTQAAVSSAQTDIQAKQAEIAAAQEELSRLRNESPRKNGLISELQEREKAKNARIAETEGRIGTLTQELEQLRASCEDERSQALATIERLTGEAEILRSRIQEKDDEIANASARITELSSLETSLEDLRAEKARLNGQITNLSARAADSETAKADLEAKKAELVDAAQKIRGLEISAMNAGLKEAAEAEKRECETRLAECESSKRELEASVQSLTDRLAGRNTQAAANASTIEMLRSQLEQQTRDAAASLAARNSAYKKELEELESKHAANIGNVAQSTVEDMEQELQQLRESCSVAGKKHKAEIKSLQEQLTKRGQNANGEAASRIAEKDKQIADLTRRCEELKAEAVAKSAEEFQAKESELRTEFLEKKKEKDDEISRLIEAHRESDAAKDAEIERLRALLTDKEKCDEELAAIRLQKANSASAVANVNANAVNVNAKEPIMGANIQLPNNSDSEEIEDASLPEGWVKVRIGKHPLVTWYKQKGTNHEQWENPAIEGNNSDPLLSENIGNGWKKLSHRNDPTFTWYQTPSGLSSYEGPPNTAKVPEPVAAPKPPAPAKERKQFNLIDLQKGLHDAIVFNNRNTFPKGYKEPINDLYRDYMGNTPYAMVQNDIKRIYSLGIYTIKETMKKYDHLNNVTDYKDYLEKLFEILIQYTKPIAPKSAFNASRRLRYGRGGSKGENKSKRKTRKNRK